ncbi:MAG: DUF4843 domain-containing protein, partial [Butyricimonas sp.]|nr:DUF4843 domain-containing protein [Butyricimonas sp.]
MKVLTLNYITFVVVVMSMVGLYSCSTDYMAYDVELKDGIYFASDSLNYQFGMQKGEDFAYDITVNMLGTPKDHDRVFGVELVADETTAKEGVHYELSKSFIIPANRIVGKISFVLHRYLDPEITQRPFVIKMRLVENDDFRLVMGNECKLEFSDTELPRPRW